MPSMTVLIYVALLSSGTLGIFGSRSQLHHREVALLTRKQSLAAQQAGDPKLAVDLDSVAATHGTSSGVYFVGVALFAVAGAILILALAIAVRPSPILLPTP